MTRVLAFGRRGHLRNNTAFAQALYPGAEVHTWSDERHIKAAYHWWGNQFYTALRSRDGHVRKEAEDYDIHEVIGRCRMLRQLPEEQARRMVHAADEAWSIVLDIGYDFVQLTPVDSFVLDVLERVASRRGIPALHPVGTPFSGRLRFSSRGELRGRVGTPASEFDLAWKTLREPAYRPDWLVGADDLPMRTILKRLAVDALKRPAFAAYRSISRDPKSFSFPPHGLLKHRMLATLGRLRASVRLEQLASRSLPSKYALLPLQFYPEAASDYWVSELAMTRHHDVTLAICRALSREIPLVVKEHPAAMGRRSARFVTALLSIPNVFVAPVLAPAGSLVADATMVVGPGSSTMLQAIAMGKHVLLAGTPFYGAAGRTVLTSISDPAAILEAANTALNLEPDVASAREVVRSFYEATARGSTGTYRPVGERPHRRPPSVDVPPELRQLLASAMAGRENVVTASRA